MLWRKCFESNAFTSTFDRDNVRAMISCLYSSVRESKTYVIVQWFYLCSVMVLYLLQYEARPDVPVHWCHYDRRARYSETSVLRSLYWATISVQSNGTAVTLLSDHLRPIKRYSSHSIERPSPSNQTVQQSLYWATISIQSDGTAVTLLSDHLYPIKPYSSHTVDLYYKPENLVTHLVSVLYSLLLFGASPPL